MMLLIRECSGRKRRRIVYECDGEGYNTDLDNEEGNDETVYDEDEIKAHANENAFMVLVDLCVIPVALRVAIKILYIA